MTEPTVSEAGIGSPEPTPTPSSTSAQDVPPPPVTSADGTIPLAVLADDGAAGEEGGDTAGGAAAGEAAGADAAGQAAGADAAGPAAGRDVAGAAAGADVAGEGDAAPTTASAPAVGEGADGPAEAADGGEPADVAMAAAAAPTSVAAAVVAGATDVQVVDEAVDEAVDEDDAVEPGRRARKLHRRRTGRTRTAIVMATAVGVALALALLGVLAARTIANSREGRAVAPDLPVRRLPSTPAAVLVALGDDGTPASFAVLSIAADGSGGTVVVLPTATAAFLDGAANPVRLDGAFASGGLDGQVRGVEGVLGISATASAGLDESGLAALFEPYAPISLTLDAPVLVTRNGVTEQLFPAGQAQLSARQAAQLLVAKATGESELARLGRTEALWRAVLAKAQGGSRGSSTATTIAGETTLPATAAPSSVATPAAPAPADLPGFLESLAAGPNGVYVLRVEPTFNPADPTAPELLQADIPYLHLLVASVMPGAVSPSNGNITFRVINPLGDPNLTYRAVGRLSFLQANVVLVTETNGPAPDRTTLQWNSAAGEVQAGAFSPALGGAVPTASDERIDGIDATVVLGRDFAGFLAGEDAKTAAATTTVPTTSTSLLPTTTTKKKANG
jgi:hypothetical protein